MHVLIYYTHTHTHTHTHTGATPNAKHSEAHELAELAALEADGLLDETQYLSAKAKLMANEAKEAKEVREVREVREPLKSGGVLGAQATGDGKEQEGYDGHAHRLWGMTPGKFGRCFSL